MKLKGLIFVGVLFLADVANSGCLDGLTTSNTVYSEIRGFYIRRNSSGDDTSHIVILDKSSCVASKSGDVTLGGTTVSHYYLSFSSKDKVLYSALLSAHTQGTTVEFRMKPTSSPGDINEIAYIISPQKARSQ